MPRQACLWAGHDKEYATPIIMILSFRSAIETEKEKLQKELQDKIAASLKNTAVEAAELVSTAIKQGDEKMAFLFLKETGILTKQRTCGCQEAARSRGAGKAGAAGYGAAYRYEQGSAG